MIRGDDAAIGYQLPRYSSFKHETLTPTLNGGRIQVPKAAAYEAQNWRRRKKTLITGNSQTGGNISERCMSRLDRTCH